MAKDATTIEAPTATLPSNLSVLGVFDSMATAEAALERLSESGFPMDKVSIIGQNLQSETRLNGFVTTKDVAGAGAKFGAVLGGLFGLLTGVAVLFLPGVGGLVILGPLAATAAGALEGAAWTGAMGAILGYFVSKQHIPKIEQHLKAGRYVIVVHGDEDEVRRSRQILEQAGAIDVTENDSHAAG